MTKTLNGVDTDALAATIAAVREDATLATFEFRLENQWEDGGLNHSTVANFFGTGQDIARERPFTLSNDEPAVLLSGDKAPNPVENLLHALAGCLTTTVVYHAAARGLKVDAVTTRFEGDLDLRGFLGLSDDVRNGYSAIRAVFDIEGDLSVEEKRELMALGPAFSPVFDVVTHGVPVTCKLEEDATAVVAA